MIKPSLSTQPDLRLFIKQRLHSDVLHFSTSSFSSWMTVLMKVIRNLQCTTLPFSCNLTLWTSCRWPSLYFTRSTLRFTNVVRINVTKVRKFCYYTAIYMCGRAVWVFCGIITVHYCVQRKSTVVESHLTGTFTTFIGTAQLCHCIPCHACGLRRHTHLSRLVTAWKFELVSRCVGQTSLYIA